MHDVCMHACIHACMPICMPDVCNTSFFILTPLSSALVLLSIQPKKSSFERIQLIFSGPNVADDRAKSQSDHRPSIIVNSDTDDKGNPVPAAEKNTHGHLMRAVVLFLEKHSSIKR